VGGRNGLKVSDNPANTWHQPTNERNLENDFLKIVDAYKADNMKLELIMVIFAEKVCGILPVLWIHAAVLRVRIGIRLRIRMLRQWLTRCQQEISLLFLSSKFLCLLLKVHLHHSSKIKSQKEVTKY
jgi:hypothetical protein